MRVFVTGAAGFVGSAVVKELLENGHEVLGLARNDANAEKLEAAGAQVHRGDLNDPDSLAAGAREADGVIHLAFIHDFSSPDAWMRNMVVDRTAVERLLAALEGTGKPFIGTSGTALAAPGRIATEEDLPSPDAPGRSGTEHVVLSAKDRGVRSAVVRLSPTTHDAGDRGGFMTQIVNAARTHGFAAYIGDGANRWNAGHRLDAARLYRLAVEKASPGSMLHASGEEGVPMRAIAETIAEGLGVPARSLTAEEAGGHFGFLSMFIGSDIPASSAKTRAALGWEPREVGLLDDMRANYFG